MKMSRMELIEKMLFEKEKVTTEELSEIFDVSEVTIRSDLSRLAGKNKEIKRIYGGAVLVKTLHNVENETIIKEDDFEKKSENNLQLVARKIAQRAFTEIEDNDVIFLGSGTTCGYLAELLKSKPKVSIVTNNISALAQLIKNGNKIYCIGGEVSTVDGNNYFSSIVDPLQYMQSIYVNKVFTSCRGIDEVAGVTVNSVISTYIYGIIPKISGTWYMMINGNKIGKVGMHGVAEVDKLDCIITDHVNEKFMEFLKQKNIEVVLI
jgi:DeoR/GlpR family transcriptional regulator of sugar metabolism